MEHISIKELPFEVTPSFIMDFNDYQVKEVDGVLKVAYLADDEDPFHPNVADEKTIFTAHRYADELEHEAMQEALGLNRDWEPDLDQLMDGADREKAFRKEWVAQAAISPEFAVWAGNTGRKEDGDERYLRNRASAFWRQQSHQGHVKDKQLWDFEFTADLALKAWQQLVSQGLIGELDAISLDCYDHGGQSWSITGNGMQCQWDTSRRAGVWVPLQHHKELIQERMATYAFGYIERVGQVWTSYLDNGTKQQCKSWHEAFVSVQLFASSQRKPTAKQLANGRARAREELCENDLEQYNAWLSGDCYGLVLAEFSNIGTEDEPEWELIASDECWGYIGSDDAVSELQHQFH